jgi:signal transduction histidine kinase
MQNKTFYRFAGAVAACVFTLAGSTALAGDRATKDDAVAFVKKTIAHYKAAGRTQALADISAKENNQFLDRDLYVAVTEINTGMAVANSRNQRMIGKNMSDLKDVDGKLFVKEQLDIAKAGKISWVDYRFPNPVTQQIENKTTYCEPYDGLIFCTGFYR